MVLDTQRSEVNPTTDLLPDPITTMNPEDRASSPAQGSKPPQQHSKSLLPSWNLRTKVTALAIALSAIPVATIGGLAYFVANQAITEDTIAAEQAATNTLTDKINRFLFERYGDIQVLANQPILNNPQGTASITLEEKQRILTDYTQTYGVYDSIAVYDLQGRLVLKSAQPADTSIKTTPEFTQTLQTGERVMSEPQMSEVTQQSVMYFLSPIRSVTSNQVIGVVRSRMPISFVEDVIQDFKLPGQDYAVIDANGQYFIDSTSNVLNQEAETNLPFIIPLRAAQDVGTETLVNPNSNHKEVITYAPFQELEGVPLLQWGALLAVDTEVAFATQQRLLVTLFIGTLATSALAAAIATLLASRATRPIQQAAQTVARIGEGDLSARLQVQGDDELAILGTNINSMATQIQTLLEAQQAETGRIEQARQEARQEADARAAEQQHQKEFLQRRALELLMEVDPVSRGDLTIRANVTPDEIGTIADSYNAIIRNLRQIVQQVQDASQAVTLTAQGNEESVKQVATEVAQQADTILAALNQVEMMAKSSQGVSERAKQAAAQMKQANQVVRAGDEAMNRTVEGISTIRETVSETTKKVKRLGEASQKISKVVNLISGFAAQTNLLALNAAIEAARAGEEGRGFSVVAEEVRALAQQSATATAEIEQLVEEIQTQTNEVVTAMESGTEQVVAGTQLVEESRQKLNQISAVSTQVNQLIQEIAQAASNQMQSSTKVSHTMQSVATIATESSKQSEAVAQSFSQLLQVAQKLQVSVAQFKVS